jgi:hypothetical protein
VAAVVRASPVGESEPEDVREGVSAGETTTEGQAPSGS